MRLKRQLAEERLSRVLARAQDKAAANPIIAVPAGDSLQRRVVPAGASRSCGTWAECADGRRLGERVPVQEAAISLRKCGSFAFQVLLADVSMRGCSISLVEAMRAGDRVIARFPGLEPFGATVSWAERLSAGIAFDRSIHPAVFDDLLDRLS